MTAIQLAPTDSQSLRFIHSLRTDNHHAINFRLVSFRRLLSNYHLAINEFNIQFGFTEAQMTNANCLRNKREQIYFFCDAEHGATANGHKLSILNVKFHSYETPQISIGNKCGELLAAADLCVSTSTAIPYLNGKCVVRMIYQC